MITVWVVTDESKSGYDAGGIFIGVFSSRENAIEYIKKFNGVVGRDFDITEEMLDSQ